MNDSTTTRARQLSLDELGSPLSGVTFVVVDLETTGGRPGVDAITEIGAVKVCGGRVLGEFATLLDPQVGIPPQVVALTGITDAMVCDAPRLEQVLPAFVEFVRGCVLVAHNAPFDTGFLRAACAAHDYPWPVETSLCTVRLARRVLPRHEVPSVRLAALAALFGAATTPRHRALDDARATVDVLHGLLERLGPLGVESLEELLAYLPRRASPHVRAKRGMADHLPEAPGVYLFRGPRQEVLYIGTASNLRRRVRGYFTAGEQRARMSEMVALATRVDSVTCSHPLEAAVCELRLIDTHKPPYNRRSVHHRAGWWITLTDEAFPRLSLVRTPRTGAVGPISSRKLASTCSETIAEVTGLRCCTQRIPARAQRGTPCALAELDRCGAPCSGAQSATDYAGAVHEAQALLAGTDSSPLTRLHTRLGRLAAAHRFEDAARLRDRLATLAGLLDRHQRIAALCEIPEMAAAAPHGAGGWQLAVIRHGKLASAGTAPRGSAPIPIVEELLARATTARPGPVPGTAADAEETSLVAGWLERRGTRLIRCTQPWAHPAGGAGSWVQWLHRARQAARDEPTTAP